MEEQKQHQQQYRTYETPETPSVQESVRMEEVTRVCPHCGTVNEPDSLFCEECGTALGHSRLCPNCRQPLDLLADFCEHCKTYVCSQRCSFCGAEVAETDAFCPECGASREGIVCPACSTRSPFSYCRVCGLPLTEEAKRLSRMVHEEPMWTNRLINDFIRTIALAEIDTSINGVFVLCCQLPKRIFDNSGRISSYAQFKIDNIFVLILVNESVIPLSRLVPALILNEFVIAS